MFFKKIHSDVAASANPPCVDEIKEYLECRYICEQDALWRIYGYDIHGKIPEVERLPVHMPNMNFVQFRSTSNLAGVVSDDFFKRTMLTEWFKTNWLHPPTWSLTYCDFPTKWSWDTSSRSWIPRKRGRKIGRLYYVHPSAGELYHLRMLLMIVRGVF